MSAPVAIISYPSLRRNTWATDVVELDSTVSALAAGVYDELDAVIERAPLVVPTSPPMVVAVANPDYAWDGETTPGRLYAFLMDIAASRPSITPSLFIETLQLVKSMLAFTWEHPVIVGNIARELELFFMRTFWNLAVRHDKGFTEEIFHELTDSRYVRCLDPSSKLILSRTMDLEDAKFKLKPAQVALAAKSLCSAYADWTVEVETKHPYVEPAAVDIEPVTVDHEPVTMDSLAAPIEKWVDEAVFMEVLPSELESLADVELALEEVLSAEIDLREELEAETVDLSTSYSNRNMLPDTPTSIASAPAILETLSPALDTQLDEAEISDTVSSVDTLPEAPEFADDVASQVSLSPVELTEYFIFAFQIRPVVRTRPPVSSQSTAVSESGVVEIEAETSEAVPSQPSMDVLESDPPTVETSDILTTDDQAPSASSSTSAGASTSFGRFFKRPAARRPMLSTANTSSFTTSSSSIRATLFSKGTWTSATSSSTNTSSDSGEDSVPTDSTLSTDSNSSDSDTPPSQSSIRKFGTFVKRLVRRRGARKSIVDTWGTNGLAPPPVAVERSEISGTTIPETEFERMPVLGRGEGPIKRGPWARLRSFSRMYGDLKMPEGTGA